MSARPLPSSVGKLVIPTLPPTVTSRPAMVNGRAMASTTRRAKASSPSMVDDPGHRIPNSSPSMRASTSLSRTTAASRCATAPRSASPAAWPRDRFTAWKPTTSSMSTATGRPSRRDWATGLPDLLAETVLLGRPVRPSWGAAWATASSSRSMACCTSAMSPPTSPTTSVGRRGLTYWVWLGAERARGGDHRGGEGPRQPPRGSGRRAPSRRAPVGGPRVPARAPRPGPGEQPRGERPPRRERAERAGEGQPCAVARGAECRASAARRRIRGGMQTGCRRHALRAQRRGGLRYMRVRRRRRHVCRGRRRATTWRLASRVSERAWYSEPRGLTSSIAVGAPRASIGEPTRGGASLRPAPRDAQPRPSTSQRVAPAPRDARPASPVASPPAVSRRATTRAGSSPRTAPGRGRRSIQHAGIDSSSSSAAITRAVVAAAARRPPSRHQGAISPAPARAGRPGVPGRCDVPAARERPERAMSSSRRSPAQDADAAGVSRPRVPRSRAAPRTRRHVVGVIDDCAVAPRPRARSSGPGSSPRTEHEGAERAA
jgi:hypothetical protein